MVRHLKLYESLTFQATLPFLLPPQITDGKLKRTVKK